MAACQNEYEQARLRRIQSNKRKMEELGIFDAREDVVRMMAKAVPKRKARTCKPPVEQHELRRSCRERTKVNYCEEPSHAERAQGVKAERKVIYLNRADLDITALGSPKIRSNVDSGKGVRIQGGRVYDSRHGVTCHWCRQKTVEDKVTCTDPGCGGGRRLPTSFCKMCLKNRHGEDVQQAEASGKWICPCCRVSCGAGCVLCCNCGPCRKKAGLAPTHQIIKEARLSGFDNVHDYLVYQDTGESAKAITARKFAAAWGKWLTEDASEAAEEQRLDAQIAQDNSPETAAVAALEQPTMRDAFQVVKVAAQLIKDTAKETSSTRGDRKLRVMKALGLAPTSA